jgi:asparagine synthase (glutamine-hydrolysing)
MSGLLAFVSDSGPAAEALDAITAAVESMHHRGGDRSAVRLAGSEAVFAVTQLPGGADQPLSYHSRYTIVFNGQLYNHTELRDELVDRHGAQFATDSDTEVVLAAYHFWGPGAVTRLRGMFAFVLWDTVARRAFGARDRFGIKPLYYVITRGGGVSGAGAGAYFASEKKALLPFVDDELDPVNLSHYLTLQYVPEPGSLTRGIGRIGSGQSFVYAPGGPLATRRYYQPSFRPAPVEEPEGLYRRIRETLGESVRAHLRSDRPVGAFLSSGIDSTALVALAREVNPGILTFTVGYDEPEYSEVEIAQASAAQLGVRLITTTVSARDVIEALPRIVWHLDDPVADPALVPLYFLARSAAEHVGAVLSGEGADELFGGYGIYREPLSLAPVAALPDPLQKGLRVLSRVIPPGVKGKSFLERGTTPIEERYYGNARIFTEEEKQHLLRRYDPSARYTDVTAGVYAEAEALDDVTTMQYVDLYTWLRGDILVKADRMTMAHSLELRAPYLDREVFEVAATIPTELKLPAHSTDTKYALRRALEPVVPAGVVNRKKLGFPTPTRSWLRGELYDWAHDIFARSGAGHLIDLDYVRRLLDEHRQKTSVDNSRKVWTVLVFCVWHAIFVERSLDVATGQRIATS